MKGRWNASILALIILLGAGLACNLDADQNNGSSGGDTQTESSSLPKKLDSYELKGIKFAYYLIPAGLEKDELVKTAKEIHESEDDTQLILVDDDSKVGEYIKYVKAISGIGELEDPMPQEWADKHIVANVQKHMNGRWVLYKSYGFEEIAELEGE
ncbi:MAG: hypothetical protein IPM63_13750 [Acidobacteriota bacterium]|nr:MAG: hypothetical protein IPM63_13750 [Acidobacteriota bacterium]